MVKNIMPQNTDDISVIIRNKNEARWIGHAIQSVVDSFVRPEIIIVDNSSADESIQIVKHFIHDPLLNKETRKYTDIKILNIKDYTPGRSINLGVQHSTRNHIMILSAHCVLKKINFKDLSNKSEKYVGIFGNQIPIWNGKKITKRYIWSHFKSEPVENMYSELEGRFFFHNAVSFFKKKNLIKDPFHDYLLGKEDRYWINERAKEGDKFLYDPNLEVEHHYTSGGNTWIGIG